MSLSHSKQTILDRLAHSDSDLESIEISSDLSDITLIFAYQCVPESRIVILLRGVVNLTVSKTLEHDKLAFLIMEATLRKLSDGGESIFHKTGYGFLEQHGNVATYPNVDLYHFHLEGEICADIVCRSFDLLVVAK